MKIKIGYFNSCGGNVLINIGPTKEGIIAPIYEERLRQMGKWLTINGNAVYGSKPWLHQNDTTNPNIWYTSKNQSVFGFLLKWPNDSLKLSALNESKFEGIRLLGYENKIDWRISNSQVIIDTSNIRLNSNLKWAWVFEFQNVSKIFTKIKTINDLFF